MDALAEVRKLIGPAPEGGWRRDLLMEHLYALHDAHRGLYKRHLLALSQEMSVPMAQVVRVATSCRDFEILADGQATPAATVRVCEGLSCDMAGSSDLLQCLPGLIDGVKAVGAPCLGYCDHAPAVLVGQAAVSRATPEEVVNALMRDSSRSVFREAQAPVVSALVDYKEYCEDGGYALAAAVANGEEDAEFVLHALDESGLCDLGGTGMPVGATWRRVRQEALESSTPASLVVDLSDCEPGSFKDRHFLERDPHRFLEGLLVAAHVVGADAAYICMRKDHHSIRVLLEAELAALAADPPCRLPRIELRRGAAPAGPEALMQSLETLYWVRDILRRGPRWFTDFGRHGSRGLRMFSVSGRVAKPGVKVAPAGITPCELVDEYCGGMAEGHELYTCVADGAAGTVIVAGHGDKARLQKFFPDAGS
ncbi:NAD(P)H-dependent oxidoreductase subunit E [Ramlibacter sp. WS9]|uniref:NAD(P)H-dependent oxidoreductase subunit E n=1 Tax=Ramlibacter sp. WS9 TaxID=1882741 RepID=UPI0011427560|nr:NAD(P)H-dependent oxidoreductase subunit E [Ramlibacter sp. WS9]ROZ72113.1 NADH-quinone oxidoreductase subunit F [Ramlibacter sp. WS9]